MSSSSKYSSEQIEQYRAQFAELDTDGSGELDEGELLAALTKLGATATEDEARKMIREADLNGNGTIDFEEFCAHMAKLTLDGAGAARARRGRRARAAACSAGSAFGRATLGPRPAGAAARLRDAALAARDHGNGGVGVPRGVWGSRRLGGDRRRGRLYRAMRSSNLRVTKAEVATMSRRPTRTERRDR